MPPRRREILPLQFAYAAVGTWPNGKRHRGHVSEDRPASVEVVPASETELVARVWQVGSRPPIDVRVVDGALMRPCVLADRSPAKTEDVARLRGDNGWQDYPSPPADRWLNSNDALEPTFACTRISCPDASLFRHVADRGAREAAAVAHDAFAASLRIVDGAIWRPTTLAWALAERAPVDTYLERYWLVPCLLDLDFPDAATKNPLPAAQAPLAMFDPRIERETIIHGLREALGDESAVLSPTTPGAVKVLGVFPEPDPTLNAWLFTLAAWNAAEAGPRGWSSIAHETRAALASLVATGTKCAPDRLGEKPMEDAIARARESLEGERDRRFRSARYAGLARDVARELGLGRSDAHDDVAALVL